MKSHNVGMWCLNFYSTVFCLQVLSHDSIMAKEFKGEIHVCEFGSLENFV